MKATDLLQGSTFYPTAQKGECRPQSYSIQDEARFVAGLPRPYRELYCQIVAKNRSPEFAMALMHEAEEMRKEGGEPGWGLE